MSDLLLDTNILLDVVDKRRPESDEARRVLELCNGGGDRGFACAMSLKDVYYVLSRFHGEKDARRLVGELMGFVILAPVSAETLDAALRSNEPDFEDGIVRAVAELEGMDFILTRNARAFAGSRVRSMTCGQYLRDVRGVS